MNDPLRPAKGFAAGLVLALPIWVAVGVLVFLAAGLFGAANG